MTESDPTRPAGLGRRSLVAAGAAIAVAAGVVGGVIAHFADGDSGSTSKLTGSTCPATTVANAVLPSVVTCRSMPRPPAATGRARLSATTATSSRTIT